MTRTALGRSLLDPAPLLSVALRHGHRIPEPLVHLAAAGTADLVPAARLRRLRSNLAQVRPELDDAALDTLTRENLRRYLRYYAQMLTLPALTQQQIRARVQHVGLHHLTAHIDRDTSVVAALSHSGNWDLAGAWVASLGLDVITVAEHLEPEEVFAGFLALRRELGMTILPLERDGSTWPALVDRVRGGPPALVPLLAERDLSRRGVPVHLLGRSARVAAGPARLAADLDLPLLAIHLRHVRLHGARRRAAGSPWGIEVRFVPVPTTGDVAADTQAWVDRMGQAIAANPADWHMLQRVWDE